MKYTTPHALACSFVVELGVGLDTRPARLNFPLQGLSTGSDPP